MIQAKKEEKKTYGSLLQVDCKAEKEDLPEVSAARIDASRIQGGDVGIGEELV